MGTAFFLRSQLRRWSYIVVERLQRVLCLKISWGDSCESATMLEIWSMDVISDQLFVMFFYSETRSIEKLFGHPYPLLHDVIENANETTKAATINFWRTFFLISYLLFFRWKSGGCFVDQKIRRFWVISFLLVQM